MRVHIRYVAGSMVNVWPTAGPVVDMRAVAAIEGGDWWSDVRRIGRQRHDGLDCQRRSSQMGLPVLYLPVPTSCIYLYLPVSTCSDTGDVEPTAIGSCPGELCADQ
jgi:hypothetical protein